MTAYATPAQLDAWLPTGTAAPTDAERLLDRASELIDSHITARFDVDETDTPTDPDVAAALADATCAVVEFWIEMGEEYDVAGLGQAESLSIGHFSITNLPDELAPRAERLLRNARLLSGAITQPGGCC